jgi:hypothetical protein
MQPEEYYDIYYVIIVILYRFTEAPQYCFPVDTIVFLIRARDYREAENIGEEIGKKYKGLDSDYFYDGRSCDCIFKGIRAVERTPGFQVSYFGISNGEVYRYKSTFRSEEDVDNYVEGNSVLAVLGGVFDENERDHLLLSEINEIRTDRMSGTGNHATSVEVSGQTS